MRVKHMVWMKNPGHCRVGGCYREVAVNGGLTVHVFTTDERVTR